MIKMMIIVTVNDDDDDDDDDDNSVSSSHHHSLTSLCALTLHSYGRCGSRPVMTLQIDAHIDK